MDRKTASIGCIKVEMLIEAIEIRDDERAAEVCDRIQEWMNRTGFMPTLEFADFEFLIGTLADLLRKRH